MLSIKNIHDYENIRLLNVPVGIKKMSGHIMIRNLSQVIRNTMYNWPLCHSVLLLLQIGLKLELHYTTYKIRGCC